MCVFSSLDICILLVIMSFWGLRGVLQCGFLGFGGSLCCSSFLELKCDVCSASTLGGAPLVSSVAGRECNLNLKGTDSSPLVTNLKWKNERESPMMWGVKWDKDWDKGYTGGTVKNAEDPKKILRQIIMIRHGQYHHSIERTDGLEPNRLTPLGFEQGYQTGLFLAQQVEQAAEKRKKVNRLASAKDALRAFTQRYLEEEVQSSTELKRTQETLNEALKVAANENDACGSLLISPIIRTMYVSNMIRARQTMDSLLEGMKEEFKRSGKGFQLPPLVTDETLVERFPCPVEPTLNKVPKKTKDSAVVAAEDVFHRYFYRPERLSSTSFFSKVMNRIPSFFSILSRNSIGAKHPARFQDEDVTVDVLVMHSNMMRYMVLRALQLPPEAWMRLSTPHCSITSLKMSESGFVNMFCYASCSHLLPHQITSRNTY